MLHGIELTNFKAFHAARLNIKPITILVGSNSSGKSSLLQLMLMLAQSGNGSGPALRTNGSLVSIGGPLNALHKRDAHAKLELCFEIDSLPIIEIAKLKGLCFQMLGVFTGYLQNYFPADASIKVSASFQDAMKQITNATAEGAKIPEEALPDVMPAFVIIAREAKKIISLNQRSVNRNGKGSVGVEIPKAVSDQNIKSHKDSLVELIDVLEAAAEALQWPRISKVKYEVGYIKSSAQLEILSIDVFAGDKSLLKFSRRDGRRRSCCLLSSEYFDQKLIAKYQPQLKGIVTFDGLEVRIADNPSVPGKPDAFASVCGSIFAKISRAVAGNFSGANIRHVSPLRAFPKRYYYADKLQGDALNTRDGDSLSEILKRRPAVRDQVNKWLNKFGMAVKVQDIHDLIQSIQVRQNGMDMDLTDVGFGISQVLPVIVQGFLAGKGAVSLIEQPEIHLHPRMQAELADLFIDMAKANSGRLIVETHSEYLLKRLRRRMAEGVVSPDDVAIHLVHGPTVGKSRASSVEIVEIADKGAFKWPSDFDVDLQDTIEFAKLQSSNVAGVSTAG